MLCGGGFPFKRGSDGVSGGMRGEDSLEDRQLTMGFETAEAVGDFQRGRPVQRSAIAGPRQCFTLAQTPMMVPFMFLMMLAQAWEPRRSAGRPMFVPPEHLR
jgi:hypothetical protein